MDSLDVADTVWTEEVYKVGLIKPLDGGVPRDKVRAATAAPARTFLNSDSSPVPREHLIFLFILYCILTDL